MLENVLTHLVENASILRQKKSIFVLNNYLFIPLWFLLQLLIRVEVFSAQ